VELLKILFLINSKALCELTATKLIVVIIDIFGNRTSDAVERLEKLHNKELNNFYSSSNIIGVFSQ
jgi:hypothetical protein